MLDGRVKFLVSSPPFHRLDAPKFTHYRTPAEESPLGASALASEGAFSENNGFSEKSRASERASRGQ